MKNVRMVSSVMAIGMGPGVNRRGFTLIELLVGSLITVAVVSAGMKFYGNMHGVSVAQSDISEMQHRGRSTLDEIVKNLRTAGFRLPAGHAAFELAGDSLVVYGRGAQPVDTTHLFLQEFSTADYALVPALPDSMTLWKLVKKVNGGPVEAYSDFIHSITYVPVNNWKVAVTVTILASRADYAYAVNEGFRKSTLGQVVEIRNLNLGT